MTIPVRLPDDVRDEIRVEPVLWEREDRAPGREPSPRTDEVTVPIQPARNASGTETSAGFVSGNQAKFTACPSIDVLLPEIAGENTISRTELTRPV